METLGVARWRAILAPWHEQLAVVSAYDKPKSFKKLIRGVRKKEKHTIRKFFLRCREAIELMQMLTVVERVSWTDMMGTLKSTSDDWNRSSRPSVRMTPYLTYIGHLLIEDFPLDEIESKILYFGFDESTMSPEFRSAMEAIDAAVTPETKRRIDEQEPESINLEFSVSKESSDISDSAHLRSISDIVRNTAARGANAAVLRQQARESGRWCYKPPFTLASVILKDVDSCAPKDPGVSGALVELIALGVQLDREIFLDVNSWFMTCSVAELGPVLQGMTDEASLQATTGIKKILPNHGYKELEITFHTDYHKVDDADMLCRRFGVILSALSASRDTKGLKIWFNDHSGEDDTPEKILQWITYALFSKDSTSSILALDLNIDPLVEVHGDVIRRVLEAKNPSKALLVDHCGNTTHTTPAHVARSQYVGQDNNADSDVDLGFAIVKAGTPIVIKPLRDSADEATESFVLQRDGRFRVMQDSDDWVDIVVPYYGHCVIARESIDRIDQGMSSESSLAAGYHNSITSLTLNGSRWKMLLPLARFIGDKLEKLEINDDFRIKCFKDRDTLSSCPNLLHLKLQNARGSTYRALIDAYESGRCRIENITIDSIDFGLEDLDDLTDFIDELGDPASHAAKTLRRLKLTDRVSLIDEDTLAAYTEMLQANRTLEYLAFRVPYQLFDRYRAALMETDGMDLRPRPLCLSSRLAFLSVVQQSSFPPTSLDSQPPQKRHCSTQQHDSRNVGLGGLDQLVISLIFEFAANPVTRRLVIDRGDERFRSFDRW